MELVIAALTLTVLEIVLGIDNVVFVSIIAGKLPQDKYKLGTNIGLGIALGLRIILLFFISFILGLDKDLFSVMGNGFSVKDLILIAGGLFLLYKATTELHQKWYGIEEHTADESSQKAPMSRVIMEIALINIVFSFDSILTAIGLTDNVLVMIIAVVVSTALMIIFAHKVGAFIQKYPTFKILALAFLVMIGGMLIGEGFGAHMNKNYMYFVFSMAFAVAIEVFNNRVRKHTEKKVIH